MLRHHPDGLIYFPDGFVCSLAELRAVYADYNVPAGARCIEYDPPGRSTIWTTAGEQKPGPMPWPEGDHVLANANTLRAAIVAARPTTPIPTRRPKGEAVILSDFDALALAQQTTLRQAAGRWLIAQWLRANPRGATDLGIPLPGDEPIS